MFRRIGDGRIVLRNDGSWRRGLRVGGFGCLSSDHVGQGRDLVQSPYAIPKITPEGHTQFPAGCLQAEKRSAIRQTVERQRHIVMNDQMLRLGAFGGPGPLSVGRGRLLLAGRRGRSTGVVERTGLRRPLRRVRYPLQPPDFLFELIDSQLLALDRRLELLMRGLQLLDDVQQGRHQRSSLLHGNRNAANAIGVRLPCHPHR